MIERIRASHGDNYSYVIYDDDQSECLLVDPVAVEGVKKFLSEQDLDPVYVINTHGHGDHTSGNQAFQFQMKARLLCHEEESSRVPKADSQLEDEQVIDLGSLKVKVLHTPGHTSGSICLKTQEGLISGDTLFLAGCGNPKFGGDTRELFETMQKKIRPLPDNLILYPGHDYAMRNLEFVSEINPGNEFAEQKLNEVKVSGMDQEEPRSTLGEERQYNPFLRYDQDELARQLEGLPAQYNYWDVFKRLRQLRNNW
ncbi:MAG: hydroxyacylglutathione hydrolase [bacterium]